MGRKVSRGNIVVDASKMNVDYCYKGKDDRGEDDGTEIAGNGVGLDKRQHDRYWNVARDKGKIENAGEGMEMKRSYVVNTSKGHTLDQ